MQVIRSKHSSTNDGCEVVDGSSITYICANVLFIYNLERICQLRIREPLSIEANTSFLKRRILRSYLVLYLRHILDNHLLLPQRRLHRVRVTEDLVNLLQTPPFRLHKREVDERDPRNVDRQVQDVEMPPRVRNPHRRCIRIDETDDIEP